ncbi:hypothetical protein P7K49_028412, partial [Saguinus oedipus]
MRLGTSTKDGAVALVNEMRCPVEKPRAFCSQELIFLKALWVGSAIFFLLHPSPKGPRKANCLKAIGLMGEAVEECGEKGEGLQKTGK